MEVRIRREDVWEPDWNGNMDLPESERVRFHHTFLSVGDRDRFQYLKPPTQDQIISGQQGNREYIQDGRGIAEKIVTGIDNLVVVDGGKKTPVETIKDFYSTLDAFDDLPAMLEAWVLSVTARIAESKNSTSGSGAGSKDTTNKPPPSGKPENTGSDQ